MPLRPFHKLLRPKTTTIAAAAAVAATLLLSGCSAPAATDASTDSAGDETLTIYATTGYLADAAKNIAPDAHVSTMVGPGGDPHTYQPSTKEIESIQQADLVLWNGLNLEAQMVELLEHRGDQQLAAAELLPEDLLLAWPESSDADLTYDPHVWNSPDAWSLVVGHVADKLGEIDPQNAATYQANAADYQAEIAAADAAADALLQDIPEPRILITGHDAFNYFGDTYGLEVYATDFVSSEAALSPGELSDLAELIAEHQVPVIFQDNQANPQAITSLREAVQALGWDVEISDQELYADSLGADAGVDTYLGVFEHNTQAIVDALGTAPTPATSPAATVPTTEVQE